MARQTRRFRRILNAALGRLRRTVCSMREAIVFRQPRRFIHRTSSGQRCLDTHEHDTEQNLWGVHGFPGCRAYVSKLANYSHPSLKKDWRIEVRIFYIYVNTRLGGWFPGALGCATVCPRCVRLLWRVVPNPRPILRRGCTQRCGTVLSGFDSVDREFQASVGGHSF